ncbi:transcriptional regulator [Rhizobium leguminosarum]|uniref:winged helix-turn-helix domain-containing protein n=1 Tax=Rhizobium leguminosarum TaxID=384 RepID=UPI0039658777
MRGQRSLTRDGLHIAIGGRALDILAALVERAGRIVGARELMDLVWHGVTVEDANLRTQLTALRKALGKGSEGSREIVKVPSQGYIRCAADPRGARSGVGAASGCRKTTPIWAWPGLLPSIYRIRGATAGFELGAARVNTFGANAGEKREK